MAVPWLYCVLTLLPNRAKSFLFFFFWSTLGGRLCQTDPPLTHPHTTHTAQCARHNNHHAFPWSARQGYGLQLDLNFCVIAGILDLGLEFDLFCSGACERLLSR